MKRTFICGRVLENGTVKDNLTERLNTIHREGFSVFGINEHNNIPHTRGLRWVEIFFRPVGEEIR